MMMKIIGPQGPRPASSLQCATVPDIEVFHCNYEGSPHKTNAVSVLASPTPSGLLGTFLSLLLFCNTASLSLV